MFPNLFTADPAAHVFSDGRLWLYADRDPKRPSKAWTAMCDYHAFSTPDLLNWIDHGSVLNCDEIGWCVGAAWDGDCIEHNGRYWYFFPMIDQIGVAVADRPEGPFRDAIGRPLITRSTPGVLPESPHGGLLVSPVVVKSPDGLFVYFGQNEELYIAELADSMVEILGPVRAVGRPEGYHEGPWVFYRGGRYHMIYGKGEIASVFEDQSDDLAYACSESPFGPFQYRNVVQADNGRTVQACLVEWEGKDVFFYHEDGPDNYHRRIRAEVVNRPADGGVDLIPRGVSPVQVESLLLSATGRHEAEDFHACAGNVERVADEAGRCGYVRLSGIDSLLRFDEWIAEVPVARLCLRVRFQTESTAKVDILSDGKRIAEVDSESIPEGEWQSLVFPLPEPIEGRFSDVMVQLTTSGRVDIRSLTFLPAVKDSSLSSL